MEELYFESTIILGEHTTEEERAEVKKEINKIIGKIESEILFEEFKPLAHELKGNKNGYYICYLWDGYRNEAQELARYIEQNDKILKYITIKADLNEIFKGN